MADNDAAVLDTPASAPADAKPADAAPAPDAGKAVVEPAAGEKAAAEAKAEAVAAYELKLPEGSAIEAAVLERTGAIARDLGLSNEQAQKIADFAIQEAASHADARLKAMQPGGAEWQKAQDQWLADTLADDKLGKTPEERKAAIQSAQQFVRQLVAADPEAGAAVTELLEHNKLGNHKLFVRGFAALAKMAGEKPLALAGAHADAGDTQAAKLAHLYPTMQQ